MVGKGVRFGALALAAVALTIGMASCGGGDDEESLTKAQFVKRATLICNEGEREREEALSAATRRLEEGESKVTPELQEEAILQILTTYERMVDKLSELSLPEGDESKVEAMVESMEEAAKRVRANPQTAVGASTAFKEANELLDDYNLK